MHVVSVSVKEDVKAMTATRLIDLDGFRRFWAVCGVFEF